jgi:hypothetical protein
MKTCGLIKAERPTNNIDDFFRLNFSRAHIFVDKFKDVLKIAENNTYMLSFSTKKR